MGGYLPAGREVQSFTYIVDASKIREMAQAVGDSNPIYFDRVSAQNKDYKDVIAPLTFGLAIKRWGSDLDWATTCAKLGIDPLRVLHGEQEFIYYGEINPGDVITVREKVVAVEEKAKIVLVMLECEYKNQHGERVLTSRQTFVERKKGDS
jgi:acyl dehydratase